MVENDQETIGKTRGTRGGELTPPPRLELLVLTRVNVIEQLGSTWSIGGEQRSAIGDPSESLITCRARCAMDSPIEPRGVLLTQPCWSPSLCLFRDESMVYPSATIQAEELAVAHADCNSGATFFEGRH